MPKKKPLAVLRTKLVDVEVAGTTKGRGSTKSIVSLQITVPSNGVTRYEWLAVVKTPVCARIRELMAVPDLVIGHDFELSVNEAGQVEAIRRVT